MAVVNLLDAAAAVSVISSHLNTSDSLTLTLQNVCIYIFYDIQLYSGNGGVTMWQHSNNLLTIKYDLIETIFQDS